MGEKAGDSRRVTLILPVLNDADIESPIHSDEPVDFVSSRESPFRRPGEGGGPVGA